MNIGVIGAGSVVGCGIGMLMIAGIKGRDLC